MFHILNHPSILGTPMTMETPIEPPGGTRPGHDFHERCHNHPWPARRHDAKALPHKKIVYWTYVVSTRSIYIYNYIVLLILLLLYLSIYLFIIIIEIIINIILLYYIYTVYTPFLPFLTSLLTTILPAGPCFARSKHPSIRSRHPKVVEQQRKPPLHSSRYPLVMYG
jgi:hypothetical protein